MRVLFAFLLLLLATPTIGQFTIPDGMDPAEFPPVPPLTMYEEVLKFRAEVERHIDELGPRVSDANEVTTLVDTLVSKWIYYGDFIDSEHGHFPNMSRERPYWLITTDEAADTLTDQLGETLEEYVQANPEEKIGLVRQFYRQQHSTWYDRYRMEVSKEDWIIHRMKSICDEPEWQLAMSFTAVGIDSGNRDLMNDKFMHRLVLIDAACPETVDFVVPLRHYRLMERELNALSDEERQAVMEGHRKELIDRGQRELGGER